MKTYKNFSKTAAMLGMFALALTSCDDWLTLYPQDRIVEEQFWEDKTDLEGVRYAAYKNMASNISNYILWGDLRSDAYKQNTVVSSEQGNRDLYQNIRSGDIDTTMSVFDWGSAYTTINYCNKVLQHGEEVLQKDAQFTSAEWYQMRAEMVTMRALNYFYLVRAFKNIPYTTKVVNSDAEVEYFPQIPADSVLGLIIADLESVEILGHCRNRFTSDSDTKGLITNTAQYCLLSDIYLWRASMRQGRGRTDEAIADYEKCKEYADLSVEKLEEQYDLKMANQPMASKDNIIEFTTGSNASILNDVTFMLKNSVNRAASGIVDMYAQRQLYVSGNSDESMFELQFSSADSRKNDAVNSYWGYGNAVHLVSSITEEDYSDMRMWFTAQKKLTGVTDAADNYVLKWCTLVPTIENAGRSDAKVNMAYATSSYRDWLVYRLSDALMQKAEACACLANMKVNIAANNTECAMILRAIRRRWYVDLQTGKEPNLDVSVKQTYDPDYSLKTTDDYLPTVMSQHKLEFSGEGKRWFALVRYAERLSSSDTDDTGMRTMFKTFYSGVITTYETMMNHSENLWGLYCPIYYMEIKAYNAYQTGLITQNPIWNKSKYDR